jgi:hypothetical protein
VWERVEIGGLGSKNASRERKWRKTEKKHLNRREKKNETEI